MDLGTEMLLFSGALGRASGGPPARTPTYYFSAAGSDANDGRTIGAPKQTISAFNSLTLTATDYVAFRGGDTFTGGMVIPASGSALSSILIGSYGIGRATFAPTNVNTNAIYAQDKSYITVDGINVTGPGGAGSGTGIFFSAQAAACSGIIVRNTAVTACGQGGIYIGNDAGGFGFANVLIDTFSTTNCLNTGVAVYGLTAGQKVHSNVTIQNGTISGCALNGGYIGNTQTGLINNCIAFNNGAAASAGPVGLWTYWSDSVTIKFCESYSNTSLNTVDGDGFDIDGGCTNCIVEYCYAHGNKGAGFLLYNDANGLTWDNNTVRFCIGENNVNGNSTYSEIFVGTGSTSLTNVKVYNNTFYNSRSAAPVVRVNDTAATGRIANNLFYSAGPSVLATVAGDPSSLLFSGNNWFSVNFSITWNSVAYTTYAAWQTATGQEKIAGVDVGKQFDPVLYNPGRGGTNTNGYSTTQPAAYKLQPGSPLIGAGLNLQSQFSINPGAQDYYGATYPFSGVFDIGAGSGASALASNGAIPSTANAFVVYSLRRLTSYAGPLIQIRRVSDSVVQDFTSAAGSIWVDTAAIATFLAATTGTISKWYDQGPNGFDVVQATAASQPAYAASGFGSNPGVSFNGTSSLLATASQAWAASDFNLFTVANLTAGAGTYRELFSIAQGTAAGVTVHMLTGSSSQDWLANDAVAVGRGTNTGVAPREIVTTPGFGDSLAHQHDLTIAAAGNDWVTDGTAKTQRVTSAGKVPAVAGAISLGVSGAFFKGAVAELVVFNTVYANRTAFRANQKAAWGTP